jgi:hypothetical protein
MLRIAVPYATITDRMREVYSETISADSLKNHRDKHMTSESDLGNVKGNPDNPTSDKILTPTEEIALLKGRVNALEIVSWVNTNPIRYTGWVSYSMKGPTSHQITYQNIVEELMPNKHNVTDQYKAFVAGIKARRVEEDGEVLVDEFVEQRANLKAKNVEEAKIAAAEAEIQEGMANKEKARDKITDLTAENIREMEKAKKDLKAREAKHAAELKAIEETAAIMEEQRVIVEEENLE